jgi:hypothetical protein
MYPRQRDFEKYFIRSIHINTDFRIDNHTNITILGEVYITSNNIHCSFKEYPVKIGNFTEHCENHSFEKLYNLIRENQYPKFHNFFIEHCKHYPLSTEHQKTIFKLYDTPISTVLMDRRNGCDGIVTQKDLDEVINDYDNSRVSFNLFIQYVFFCSSVYIAILTWIDEICFLWNDSLTQCASRKISSHKKHQ